tara:strand:- start:541 stop:702 length:162 start_codon:yes stop_codon:yes gene_type:complete
MNEFDRRKFLKTGFLGLAGLLAVFSTFKPFNLWSKFYGKKNGDSVFVPRDSNH